MLRIPSRVMEIVENFVIFYLLIGAMVGFIYSFWGVSPAYPMIAMVTLILLFQCIPALKKSGTAATPVEVQEQVHRADGTLEELLSLLGVVALSTVVGVLAFMALRWVCHQAVFQAAVIVLFGVTVVVYVTKR